jgi:hypothetical protein
MELENIIKELRKVKFKYSRKFSAQFMENWSDEQKEKFYKNNENAYEALEVAISCVNIVSELENITKLTNK